MSSRIEGIVVRLHGLHPRLIDLSLDRLRVLLAKLDHPERRLPPVIHVAGTNGKGSTCAYLRAMSEAPLVIANERGYFAAEGLRVEFVEFTLTADALPALGTGDLDAMSGGVNPALFNAVARGVNVQIVANGGTVGSGHDYQAVMVRTDHLESGRYREPRDLKGMRVAIPGQYTVVHYMLKVLLEQNGLTLADVHAVPLPLPDSSQAMANKAVDALSSIESFLAQT